MKRIKTLLILIIFVILGALGYLWVKEKTIELVLVGDRNILIEYGHTYLDEGLNIMYKDKLIDNIKAQYNILEHKKLGTYELIYDYKWLFKQKTAIRTVKIIDTENPVITLIGASKYKIKIKEVFVDPGVKAHDNYEGKIEDFNVIGKVDNNKVGIYTLTYGVRDTSGNRASVSRSIEVYKPVVKVVPKPIFLKPNISNQQPTDANKPGVIYLTFDDGPNSSKTGAVLDILKNENIKGTFFVTGNGLDSLIKRTYDEGHVVALHTQTHIYSQVYASVESYYEDVNRVSRRVENITGIKSNIIVFLEGVQTVSVVNVRQVS